MTESEWILGPVRSIVRPCEKLKLDLSCWFIIHTVPSEEIMWHPCSIGDITALFTICELSIGLPQLDRVFRVRDPMECVNDATVVEARNLRTETGFVEMIPIQVFHAVDLNEACSRSRSKASILVREPGLVELCMFSCAVCNYGSVACGRK